MSRDPEISRQIGKLEAYQSFFSTVDGVEVLSDLLHFCNFMITTHGEGRDIHVEEGKRQVMMYILSKTNTSSKELLDFISRQKKRYYDEEANESII